LEHKAALTIHYKSMMADVKDFAKGRFDELTA
jgi:hypothetical protein